MPKPKIVKFGAVIVGITPLSKLPAKLNLIALGKFKLGKTPFKLLPFKTVLFLRVRIQQKTLKRVFFLRSKKTRITSISRENSTTFLYLLQLFHVNSNENTNSVQVHTKSQ